MRFANGGDSLTINVNACKEGHSMRRKFGIVILFLIVIGGWSFAQEIKPVAVSPGSENEVARVGERCPTFSWSAVGWAASYRVAVFEARTAEIKAFESMALAAIPVLRKEIGGKALSWTPSASEQLKDGGLYVWYVQALDASGNGLWSEGKTFLVEVERTGVIGLEDRVKRKLRERGVSGDVIAEVTREMRSATSAGTVSKDFTLKAPDKSPAGILGGRLGQDSIGIRDQGNEVGSNTWYGQSAAASILGDAYQNSFFGYRSGNKTTSGDYNTLVGSYAGYYNTTGGSNTFLGYRAGYANTTGGSNTFLGFYAGRFDTTGNKNVFVGYGAGHSNQTGSQNTFLGSDAGKGSTTADSKTCVGYAAGFTGGGGTCTFIGSEAGFSNSHGIQNTFIGDMAGKGNTTGSYNTFIGCFSGHGTDKGRENTYVGVESGRGNDGNGNTAVGFHSGFMSGGAGNTFIGHSAGNVTTGDGNVFVGDHAGYHNRSGKNNAFFGWDAGSENTTGQINTFIGSRAGYLNQTGTGNTFIGGAAGFRNLSGSDNVFIGQEAGLEETGSDKLYISNSGASFPLIYGDFRSHRVSVNAYLGVMVQGPTQPVEVSGGAYCDGKAWIDASSRSLKENIRDLTIEDARETLLGLVPVRYNYKADTSDEHLGFIAEDVPALVASKDRKGMSAMDVVAVLTRVVQEQQKTINELQREVDALKKK